MRNILTLLACLVLAPVATGCSRSGDYCELACQCENCSDTEYDECIINYEASEDTASAYGCLDDFYRADDCVIAKNDCLLDNFAPEAECLDEIADVAECINDNSSL